MIAVSYLMKRKIKKIFFEVIFYKNFFYIIFLFKEVFNNQDFAQLTGEVDTSNTVILLNTITKLN